MKNYLRKVVCSKWLGTTWVPNDNIHKGCRLQVQEHTAIHVSQFHPESPYNFLPMRLKNQNELLVKIISKFFGRGFDTAT